MRSRQSEGTSNPESHSGPIPTHGGSAHAYIRAIATLDSDGRHVLFGGTVNGLNEELSLFETRNGSVDLRRIAPPRALADPRVEQAWRLDADDVLLLISEIDPP